MRKVLWLFAVLYLSLPTRAFGQARAKVAPAVKPLFGECIDILDGDTIEILHKNKPVRVQLQAIDAPEKEQAFGPLAKNFTSQSIFKKRVAVFPVGKDEYGRTLGWVFFGKTHINSELVRIGLAWHDKHNAAKEKRLAILEQRARTAKVGLWGDPYAIPPRDWRRNRSSPTSTPTTAPDPAAASPASTSPSLLLYGLMGVVYLAIGIAIGTRFKKSRASG